MVVQGGRRGLDDTIPQLLSFFVAKKTSPRSACWASGVGVVAVLGGGCVVAPQGLLVMVHPALWWWPIIVNDFII